MNGLSLTDYQIDALKEFQNIGAGHASNALARLLDHKVLISTTNCYNIPSNEFIKFLSSNNNSNEYSVYIKICEEVSGAMLMMIDDDSAKTLYNIIDPDTKNINGPEDERFQSGMKELGTILTGAFFSAISDMLKVKTCQEAPKFSFSKPETFMYDICDNIFGDKNERLCLATKIYIKGKNANNSMVYIPNKKAVAVILNKMEGVYE